MYLPNSIRPILIAAVWELWKQGWTKEDLATLFRIERESVEAIVKHTIAESDAFGRANGSLIVAAERKAA